MPVLIVNGLAVTLLMIGPPVRHRHGRVDDSRTADRDQNQRPATMAARFAGIDGPLRCGLWTTLW